MNLLEDWNIIENFKTLCLQQKKNGRNMFDTFSMFVKIQIQHSYRLYNYLNID